MIASIILIFIVGYLIIVFEHPLKLDKTVPALLMGALMWAVVAVGFFNGGLNIVDGHNHVFSMAGLTDQAAIEANEEDSNKGYNKSYHKVHFKRLILKT